MKGMIQKHLQKGIAGLKKGKFIFFTSLLAAILLAGQAKAQLQKGYALVGGDIAAFSVGLNSGNVFNISITPKAAWFIKDNLAIGGYVNLGLSGSKYVAPYSTYGFGPMGRYYVNDPHVNLSKATRFFVEVNVGFQGTNDANAHNSTNGLGFGFGPGIAHFITSNVGLEALLKYNGVAGFGSTAYQNNLALTLGLQVYLPGKRIIAAAKGQ